MAFKMKGFSGFKSEGPKKPKSIVSAKRKSIDRHQADKAMDPHPDSDAHYSAVPTFSDQIGEAMNNRKNKKK